MNAKTTLVSLRRECDGVVFLFKKENAERILEIRDSGWSHAGGDGWKYEDSIFAREIAKAAKTEATEQKE